MKKYIFKKIVGRLLATYSETFADFLLWKRTVVNILLRKIMNVEMSESDWQHVNASPTTTAQSVGLSRPL